MDQIPAPVQTAKSPEILRSNAFELPGFMNRFLGSVYVNDIQGNPFQPDVTYRGYVASPLLGTPQGLSVYMDGVRLNQPFGDVVSWDLIPLTAISSIVLQPGSNPLFGLNTLGGALSIQTKDGRSNPGTTLLGFYGQYNRASLQFESGGAWDNGVDAYATGNLFREDGWRDDSPSRIGQIFAKIGWRDASSSVSLTGAYADNKLTGNGLQEQRFLARDYASVYTKPDDTDNQSLLLQSGRQPCSQGRRSAVRQPLLPEDQDCDLQRRHQRRIARSGVVPAQRGRASGACRRPATPGSRPAGKMRRTRRFPTGGALPTRCSTKSRTRSATAF